MQKLLNDLKDKEREMVALEAMLEQDFENGNLEAACDRAYRAYYNSRQNVAKKIVSITGEAVDMKTALRMVDQRSAELTRLFTERKATA